MGTELIIMITADVVAIGGAIGYFLIQVGKNKHKIDENTRRIAALEQSDKVRTSGREEILKQLVEIKTNYAHMADDIKELKEAIKNGK